MSPHVLGFDLSLRAPAAVALPLDWHPGDWKRVRTWATTTPEPETTADLIGQLKRYRFIASWALDVVRTVNAWPRSVVAGAYVEDYGFRQNTAHASRIMGSGEIVRLELYERLKCLLIPRTAATCRKFMLGVIPRKAGDPKVVVQAALWRAGAPLAKRLVEKHTRWRARASECWSEDVCDAFVVCNAGLAESGGTALSLAAPEGNGRKKR